MNLLQRHFVAIVAFVILCLTSLNCASLNEYFHSAGLNVRRDPKDYTLEDRREYRKFLFFKRIKEKDEDRKILKRLSEEKEREATGKKSDKK